MYNPTKNKDPILLFLISIASLLLLFLGWHFVEGLWYGTGGIYSAQAALGRITNFFGFSLAFLFPAIVFRYLMHTSPSQQIAMFSKYIFYLSIIGIIIGLIKPLLLFLFVAWLASVWT